MTKRIRTYALAALLVAAGAFLGNVFAQEEGGGGMGMAMPQWMSKTSEHADLGKMAGDWTVAYRIWMGPDMEPMECTGACTSTLIMDGFFLQQDFTSTFEGMTFQGRSILGFDTIAKEWVNVWIDSMSPFLYVARGTMKDGVLQSEGMEPDMMTGQLKKGRSTMKWKDDDTMLYDAWSVTLEGKEYKSGEFVYTRVK